MQAKGFGFELPFNFADSLFGFRYAVDLSNTKVTPDSVFFRKSVQTGSEGVLKVEGDYEVGKNRLAASARWASSKLGLDLGLDLDSQNYVNKVDLSKSLAVDDKQVTLSGSYDLRSQAVAAGVDIKVEQTNFGLAYDAADKDVELSVSHHIDANNVVTPSVRSSRQVGLGLLHSWAGGSVKTKYTYPQDRLSVEWRDHGVSGTWLTKAELSVRDVKQTKFSLSRDFNY
ncbi:hypothetical protein EON64_09350 [archaeon]|nr:MAG: hypothetical protein EON64_09350 [archaeon]